MYRPCVSHLSYEDGSGGVDIEDFWEGSVQDQGNALRILVYSTGFSSFVSNLILSVNFFIETYDLRDS